VYYVRNPECPTAGLSLPREPGCRIEDWTWVVKSERSSMMGG
jgi:hypothetical protein